jgi:hypothetical protein
LGGHPAGLRLGSWIAAVPGGGARIPSATARTSRAGGAAGPAGITYPGI